MERVRGGSRYGSGDCFAPGSCSLFCAMFGRLFTWAWCRSGCLRPLPWVALAVSVGVLVPSKSFAQQRAAAEMLFEEGRKAMDAGDFDTACAKFEESNRLDAASGTTLNLANCEERRGHTASAWERYRAAVRLLAEGDRRREFAKAKVKQLEELVPHLTIELSSEAPADTEVVRNGKRLTASLGSPLPLDPGEYTITATAPGRRAADYQVTLEEGEQKSISVEPGPPVEQAKGEPNPVVVVNTDDDKPSRALGYVFGGIGAAALAGAGLFGYLAYENAKFIEKDCDLDGPSEMKLCRSSAALKAQDQGANQAVLANVLAAAGTVSLGVGLYFWFTAPDEPLGKVEAGVFDGSPGLRVQGSF